MAEQSLKEKTKKALYWKAAEQFANQGIQFIIGVAMARMLSPSDYGITAIPAVFLALAGVFIGPGFGEALIRKPDLKEEDLSTAFFYSFGMGIFFYIVLFLSAPFIADFYETPILTPLTRVTALSFIYGAIGTPQSILLNRNLNFRTPAKITIVTQIVAGFVGIIMAYIGYGVWALVISSLVGGVIGQMSLLFAVKWYPKTGWSKKSFKYLWGYGNKMIMASLLDTGYNNITPIVVGKFYSTAALGEYNRAKSYANLPSYNVFTVIRQVSFPVLSQIQDNEPLLIATYRRMIKMSAFVIFPIMLLLAALAKPLIIIIVTDKWAGCIILLQLICFSMMWLPVHALNLNILRVKARADLLLKLEIAKKIIGLIVMCAFLPLGLVYFCAAGIVSSIVGVYINSWYTGKMYDFGFWKQLKDLCPILLLSLTMFVIIILVNSLISSLWLQLVVGLPIGVAVYLGGSMLFGFEELADIKYMFTRNRG